MTGRPLREKVACKAAITNNYNICLRRCTPHYSFFHSYCSFNNMVYDQGTQPGKSTQAHGGPIWEDIQLSTDTTWLLSKSVPYRLCPTGRSGIYDESVSHCRRKGANKMPTSSSISMEWYTISVMEKRTSSRSLPVGMGVARVRERIERAKMACKETENFIVGSTLGTKVYATSRPQL